MIRIPHPAVRRMLATAALLGVVGAAHAQVGVSVGINTPGVYGQINIGGGVPAPELLMPQAVVAVPPPVVVGVPPPAPLYLHVPPGYERHWRLHCRAYNACGRPVYFVSDHWYRNVYVPHRARYGGPPPRGPGYGGPPHAIEHRGEMRHEEHRAEARHEEHREEHREDHR